jgi:hypothetical protein
MRFEFELQRIPVGRRYNPAVDCLGHYVSIAPTFKDALQEAHRELGAGADTGTRLVWDFPL